MDATMSDNQSNAKSSGFNAAVKSGLTPQFILTLVIAIGGGIFTYAKTSAENQAVAKEVDQLQSELKDLRSRASATDIALAKADLQTMYVSNELKKLDVKIDRIADAVGAKKQ